MGIRAGTDGARPVGRNTGADVQARQLRSPISHDERKGGVFTGMVPSGDCRLPGRNRRSSCRDRAVRMG